MGKFDSIQKTKQRKRKYYSDCEKIYKNFRSVNDSYSYLESIYVETLMEINKKKYNKDLIRLWGELEMKSYIDYQLGNTYNLYYTNCSKRVPIHKFDNYNFLPEDSRMSSLLDVKYIKHFEIEKVEFQDTYLATFEIMDKDNEFRPYVLLFTKDNMGKFIEYGYGYDSNNNGNVELFIPSFNYPIFLTSKGFITTPLSSKKVKLDVYDYITQDDVAKLYNVSK